METDACEVEPYDFSPLSQHILAAADFMHCCSLTHRNDSSASVEPVLLIQKPEASLALQTYLPRQRQVCVMYVCTRGCPTRKETSYSDQLGIYST